MQQSLKQNQHEDLVMNYKLFEKLFKSKIILGRPIPKELIIKGLCYKLVHLQNLYNPKLNLQLPTYDKSTSHCGSR